MDNVNQPPGQPPPDHSPTQPYRFTPGWPGNAAAQPSQPSQPSRPPRPRRDWKHSKRLRWGAGITAAVLLGAGGLLVGLKLDGSGGPGGPGAPVNTAQATALNSALDSFAAGACARRTGGGAAGSPGTSSTSAPSGKAGTSARRGCLRLRLRGIRGMYGEVAFHTSGGTQTLAFERGTVVSSAGSELVVRAPNGTEWTWDTASSPLVRESGKAASDRALTAGARVFVGGQVVGSARDAKLIVIRVKKSSADEPAGPASGSSAGSAGGSSSSSSA